MTDSKLILLGDLNPSQKFGGAVFRETQTEYILQMEFARQFVCQPEEDEFRQYLMIDDKGKTDSRDKGGNALGPEKKRQTIKGSETTVPHI